MLLQESVRLTGEGGEEAVFPSVGKPQKGMSLPLDIIMSHGDRCLLGEFFSFFPISLKLLLTVLPENKSLQIRTFCNLW